MSSRSSDLVYKDLAVDPESMAKEDSLAAAAQVRKMYARTKSTQSHAHRMENLTWRMMALALKKNEEEDERKPALNEARNPNLLMIAKPITCLQLSKH